MKVKEILSQLQFENPEAEVKPSSDGNGNIWLVVAPPAQPLGESMLADEAAVSALGAHAARMERIRSAVAAFYGLLVKYKLHTSTDSEYMELVVKSPTGKTMATVSLTINCIL